ncbi:MAG: GAF domain-containing sensor histidine kinase [Bacteroidota bacterium]|nr:GAF domain-containing sensor histidine kinase [Bacteroidota bacterium]MDX5431052.1 GAF domain-containing sensor histidine kinase [Bacteroidota bacterium]MDX5469806.1 GAF domain-containing sensor histidine kinase [Bacteroidota bacterium]
MLAPGIPLNETERLAILESLNFLDDQADQQLHDIATLTSKFCEVPIVLVSIVKQDTQEFYVNHGLSAQSTSREVSFCGHAILQDKVFVVEDASHDERFQDNPLVTGDPNISFYAGYPIRVKGQKIGTLCMIDQKPRKLSPLQQEFHEVMAKQVEQILNQKAFMESYMNVLHQLESASTVIEENFQRFRDVISAISHDAIAPVRTIKTLVDLSKDDESIDMNAFTEEMDKSLSSSEQLLTSLLEWGVQLASEGKSSKVMVSLRKIMEAIHYELKQELIMKGNVLKFKGEEIALQCDEHKLRFILRNLIKNANKFTQAGEITVEWEKDDSSYILLKVSDTGVGIDEERLKKINTIQEINPGTGTQGEVGFGVGLKLVQRFSQALGGTLKVSSQPGIGTICSLRFPII